MNSDDYALSMKISPRGRIASESLRQLMVNRLTPTVKAVMRRPIGKGANRLSVLCESCGRWTYGKGDAPPEWVCRWCDTRYRAEFVVYEEVPAEVDRRP